MRPAAASAVAAIPLSRSLAAWQLCFGQPLVQGEHPLHQPRHALAPRRVGAMGRSMQ